MSKATSKYRPSLTAELIEHLIVLATKDLTSFEAINTTESRNALAVLAPFKAKIQNAGIVPAYTISSTPRPTLADSLGMTTSQPLSTGESKEEYWERCYQKYLTAPLTCTYADLQAAYEHMYLNSLFTPEQLIAFESGTLLPEGTK